MWKPGLSENVEDGFSLMTRQEYDLVNVLKHKRYYTVYVKHVLFLAESWATPRVKAREIPVRP